MLDRRFVVENAEKVQEVLEILDNYYRQVRRLSSDVLARFAEKEVPELASVENVLSVRDNDLLKQAAAAINAVDERHVVAPLAARIDYYGSLWKVVGWIFQQKHAATAAAE